MSSLLFVTGFCLLYIFVLFWNAVSKHLSLIDFLMLSAVALLPVAFEWFPETFNQLTAVLTNVETPFVLLAGTLFVVVFAFLYRIVVLIENLKQTNTMLVQELSLLRHQAAQGEVSF